MTLKGIIEKLVADEARQWFRSVCKEEGVNVYSVLNPVDGIDLEKGRTEYTFSVNLRISMTHEDWVTENYLIVTVGGTVDDIYGVLCSCIRRDANYLWLATAKGREAFGITEFRLKED